MADEETLCILRLGVDAWNDWYEPKRRHADLARADLRCIDLAGIDFTNANLEWADLQYANLSGANLRSARLIGAKLARANLRGTCLRSAVGLTQAQLDPAEGDSSTQLPPGLQHPNHWVAKVDFWEPTGKEAKAANAPGVGSLTAAH